MHLAYDVSRCPNDTCYLRNKCKRWLAPGRPDSEGAQVMTFFPVPTEPDECPTRIPINEN